MNNFRIEDLYTVYVNLCAADRAGRDAAAATAAAAAVCCSMIIYIYLYKYIYINNYIYRYWQSV